MSYSFVSVFLFLSTVGETTLSPNPPKQWIGSFNTGYKKKKKGGLDAKENKKQNGASFYFLLRLSCLFFITQFDIWGILIRKNLLRAFFFN